MCVISSPLTALLEGTVNLHRLLKAPPPPPPSPLERRSVPLRPSPEPLRQLPPGAGSGASPRRWAAAVSWRQQGPHELPRSQGKADATKGLRGGRACSGRLLQLPVRHSASCLLGFDVQFMWLPTQARPFGTGGTPGVVRGLREPGLGALPQPQARQHRQSPGRRRRFVARAGLEALAGEHSACRVRRGLGL